MFARDLARATIWGILFRLPCAGFTPGGAYDQRPTGRVRSHPWSATNFRPQTRLRKGDTPDRGGRWTTTGKQRRSIRRDARPALIGRVESARRGHQVQTRTFEWSEGRRSVAGQKIRIRLKAYDHE